MNLTRLSIKEKGEAILHRSQERQAMYERILKLFCVCDIKKIRLIVENPYAATHFLVNNFPYEAAFVDKDRTIRGDYYKKPTQYFFLNCKPTDGITFQAPAKHKRIASGSPGIKAGICSEDRSMISPDYARNFICDFILGKEQIGSQLQLFTE